MSRHLPTGRIILSFSPLPQTAWGTDQELGDDQHVVRTIRHWGDHLRRAIRIAEFLSTHGWRLALSSEVVLAEKCTELAQLRVPARELKDDLRALTAAAESESESGGGFLAMDGNELHIRSDGGFRPLVDG